MKLETILSICFPFLIFLNTNLSAQKNQPFLLAIESMETTKIFLIGGNLIALNSTRKNLVCKKKWN